MKTQIEHTAGPWRLETDSPKGFLILKDEPHPSHAPVWTVANVNRCMGAESKANARLIAAAPELLEALKHAARCLAWHNEKHGCGMDQWTVDKARAAINEAQGAGVKYKIECRFAYGWDDATWHDDGQAPAVFETRAAAQEAINEHVECSAAAFAAGDLEEAYRADDYRITEA